MVKGASKGEGLGNKFLSNLREVDLLIHVVRCFEDDLVTHVANKVDPIHDIEIINTELTLSDLESCEKHITRVTKLAKSQDKQAKLDLELLNRAKEILNEGKMLISSHDEEFLEELRQYSFITTKPTLFVANIDDSLDENNPHLQNSHRHN